MRIIMLEDMAKGFAKLSMNRGGGGRNIWDPEHIIWMCDTVGMRSYLPNRKPVKVWNRDTPNEAYLSWSGCQELIRRNWSRGGKRREEVEEVMWKHTKEK